MNDFPELHSFQPPTTNYGRDAYPLAMPCVSMQEISLDDDFVRNDIPRLTDSLSDWFTEDSCCYTAKDAIKDLNDATTWSPSSPLKNAKQKSETPERGACAVCGMKASGVHYGGRSCEGCKSFFKRAVQTQTFRNFFCRGKGTCSLLHCHADYCRRCRWNKCLSAGLQINGVRRGAMAGRAGRPKQKQTSTS